MGMLIVAGVGGVAVAQEASPPRPTPVMGTYATGTTHLPSSGRDGCWLEAAPITKDSVRVQVLCRYPAPGHHLGVLDARLPLLGDSLVYEQREAKTHCRIRMRFTPGRVLVAQEGSDLACGFGANVDLSGTYRLLNGKHPPFDLGPIERPSPPRASERVSPRTGSAI